MATISPTQVLVGHLNKCLENGDYEGAAKTMSILQDNYDRMNRK